MSYNTFRHILLTLILSLIMAGPSMAFNKPAAMKMIMVNTLMQYGEKLYDRGDFKEATAVFNHVLTYDSQQSRALQFLKKMGHGRLQDFENNDDLIKAIEAKKHSIEALKVQIAQLRANLASASGE